MYSRNLFVLDFARRFFVSCAQILEALALRPPLKFGCDWRKIGRKGKCMKDSESTFYLFLKSYFLKSPTQADINIVLSEYCYSSVYPLRNRKA